MKHTSLSKLVAMLCVVTLLATMFGVLPVLAETNPIISANEVSAAVGGNAKVVISASNAAEMNAFGITLTYDSTKMTPVAVQDEGSEKIVVPTDYFKSLAAKGLTVYEANTEQAGVIKIAVASNSLAETNDLVNLFEITFATNSGVPAGTQIPVTVTVDSAVGTSGDILSATKEDGKVTIETYTYKSYETPAQVTVDYGTSAKVLKSKLPPEVTIGIAESNSITFEAKVDWDTSNYRSTNTKLQTITGFITLPNGVVTQDGKQPVAEINVKVRPDSSDDDDNNGGNWNGGGTIGQDYDKHIAYMNGYGDGSIRPDASITRAEVAAVLHRVMMMEGLADPAIDMQSPTFTDVNTSHWAYKDIEVLVQRGILSGYGDGTFQPSSPITRAEYAKVMAIYKNLDINNLHSSFEDVDGHWADAYIAAVSAKGYVVGYVDGTFRPQNSLTRAEIATATNRLLGRNPITTELDKVCVNPYWDITKEHWAYYQIMEAAVSHSYNVWSAGEAWYKLI